MGLKIFMNGQLVDEGQAKVSVFDHGLLYGDGVFEGIRSYNCLVFRLDAHIDRLYKSAEGIRLEIPMGKEEMKKRTIETLKANNISDGYIRTIITRGKGDLGINPLNCGKPSIIIIADKISLYPEEFYEKGLTIITAKTRRNSSFALPPTIKSLNYLNNILAKIEATDAGTEEALMLNVEGYVSECTGDNVFMIKNGKLITPLIESGALEGITRRAVMDIAESKGIKVEEIMMRPQELLEADEFFLTGTAAEIVPVIELDGKKIGRGGVGEMTKIFIEDFRRLTKTDGEKYAL